MSLRLERRGGALVGATLAVVTLAALLAVLGLFPAVAEAQTEPQSASSVVVKPGDSLWSISQQRLGPNATPQQIANEVEQIYSLNRERIGADPGLIMVGQELLVPPVMGEPSRAEPSTGATRARSTDDEPAKVGSTDQAAGSGTNRVSRKVVREAAGKTGNAPKPVPETATLPSLQASKAVPAVGSVRAGDPADPSTSPVASFTSTRLFGLGIIVLAGCPVVLLLLMSRIYEHREAKRRSSRERIFGNNYTFFDPLADFEDTLRVASEARGPTVPSGGSENGGIDPEERFARVGLFAIARAKLGRVRRQRSLGFGRPSRRYPEPDVRGPGYRSALRQQVPTRSQKTSLRGRRRAAGTTTIAAAKGPRARRHDEWEPGGALRNGLGGLSLRTETDQRENLARLKPDLEEALRTLARLERQRGLSDRERRRDQALRMLMSATREVK